MSHRFQLGKAELMGKKLIIDILTCKPITITNQDLDGLDILFFILGIALRSLTLVYSQLRANIYTTNRTELVRLFQLIELDTWDPWIMLISSMCLCANFRTG